MPLAITDYVVPVLAILFLWRGWHSGFLQTLIFPFSLLICSVVAMLFFDLTKNIILALLITIVGTIVLAFVLSSIFSLWRTSIDQQYRNYVFWASRILGGVFSFFWLGSLSLILLLLFSVMPLHTQPLIKAQNDVMASCSYNWAFLNILARTPAGINIYLALSIFRDPQKLEELSQTEEFEAFFSDPEIQKIMSDKGLAQEIKNKNILGVLSHPQLATIFWDTELMEKLASLGARIYESGRKK